MSGKEEARGNPGGFQAVLGVHAKPEVLWEREEQTEWIEACPKDGIYGMQFVLTPPRRIIPRQDACPRLLVQLLRKASRRETSLPPEETGKEKGGKPALL